MIMHHHF